MDYLYGGLTPEHPTVVAGLFIPDMPQDWTPYASTLQLLLNFRPWMEVVVFSTDVQVKSAVVKLGAHCLDEYPLVRHCACGGNAMAPQRDIHVCRGLRHWCALALLWVAGYHRAMASTHSWVACYQH